MSEARPSPWPAAEAPEADGLHDAPIIWRSDMPRAVFSGIMAVILAGLALGLGFSAAVTPFAAMSVIARIATFVVLFALFLLCAGLAQYVWRNARGFWKGWVAADAEGIAYHLPRDRSLVHRPPAAEGRYAWATVDRLETRLEGYRSQLMAMVQRTYWLVPREGTKLLLFEDRALDTPYAIRRGEDAFAKLAQIGAVPMVEAAMVEGRGGLLGAWFTAPPADDAPALGPDGERSLWRRAGMTGRLAGLALLVVLVAMALSKLL
ncbi:hypothetical protein [Aurantiacibacter flavus]|uniref:DUF4105 domain-containing protein n=1 Tax=Aurantiacibacter flavus TaxID=3145232 RepID=A0ABV0CZ58_9SPHN